MKVVLADGNTVAAEDTELGRGGMGTVYAAKDGHNVVKLFHNETADLANAMELILGHYNCTRDPSDANRENYWNALYVWPSAIVRKPRLGLLIPRYPKGMLSLMHLFAKKSYAALPPDAKRWNRRVLLAWRLSQAIARMHLMGLAHSDLSQNNVLANPTTGQLRIIDMDGLVVPGFVPPTVLGTPGYIAPEVLAQREHPNTATDKHALSVLLYQLLLGRHPLQGPFTYGLDPFETDEIEARQLGEDGIYIEHPRDTRNRPAKMAYTAAMLGDTIKGLFERAFVEGLRNPGARPRADQWKSAIGRLHDRLVTCSNPACVDQFFPVREGQTIQCPWCGTRLAIPGGLPVLRLYDAGNKGPTPVQDFWIAGYPGKTLNVWHRVRNGEPDPFLDQKPIARIDRQGTAWSLVNVDTPGMAEMDAKGAEKALVSVGQAVALRDGAILRLGPAPDARFILVQWIK